MGDVYRQALPRVLVQSGQAPEAAPELSVSETKSIVQRSFGAPSGSRIGSDAWLHRFLPRRCTARPSSR